MLRDLKKVILIILIASMAIVGFSCKAKPKHKWVEVGASTTTQKIEPGVHPERGSVSDAVPIVLVPVMVPMGRDAKGVAQYKKYLYEMEDVEITPELIDEALKSVGVIGDDSLFCDLVLTDVPESEQINAGPGASGNLTQKGTVRYVDLSSELDNSDDYEGKYYATDLAGLIDRHDIEHCITETFLENFQLVSCDITPVDMDIYRQVHSK